jgi:predicted anti-sigma-YlaC factor YlaD
VRALRPQCERAREYVSLALDGELSELEQRLLAAHVGGCLDCADYMRSVQASTALLRRSDAVRPEAVISIGPPRLRHLRLVQGAAAAVAVAAAVGLGSLAGTLSTGGSGSQAPSRAVAKEQTQQPYVEQRMLAMLRISALRNPGRHPIPS